MSAKTMIRASARTAAFAALVVAGAASAQGLADLGLSDTQIAAIRYQLAQPVVAPGIAFGSPVGFGAGWGEIYGAVGGNTQPENSSGDRLDGSATLGVGLGDPVNFIGADIGVTAISLKDSFGSDGNVAVKLHHALPEYRAGFAIGVENVGRWGAAKTQRSSTYVVGTKVFDLLPQMPASINVGFGDHRFVDPFHTGIGVFGSAAVVVHPQASVIVDYTGRDTNAGVSLVPIKTWPVVLSLGAINLGRRNGNDVEFAGGLGYTLHF